MNYADLLEAKCPVGVAQLKAAWSNGSDKSNPDFIVGVGDIGKDILEELGMEEAKMPASEHVWGVLICTALCRKDETPERILSGFGQHLAACDQLGA